MIEPVLDALKKNPKVKKVLAVGEAKVGKIAGQVLSNERLISGVQSVASSFSQARGKVDKTFRQLASRMNLVSGEELERLQRRLDEVERSLKNFDGKLNRLSTKSESSKGHESSGKGEASKG